MDAKTHALHVQIESLQEDLKRISGMLEKLKNTQEARANKTLVSMLDIMSAAFNSEMVRLILDIEDGVFKIRASPETRAET